MSISEIISQHLPGILTQIPVFLVTFYGLYLIKLSHAKQTGEPIPVPILCTKGIEKAGNMNGWDQIDVLGRLMLINAFMISFLINSTSAV